MPPPTCHEKVPPQAAARFARVQNRHRRLDISNTLRVLLSLLALDGTALLQRNRLRASTDSALWLVIFFIHFIVVFYL